MKSLKKLKVALVYDRVNKWGGAERVLLALHELFPKAPLYTSVYNKKSAPWAKVFKVKTSFLQKVPLVRDFHELFAAFMPHAFEDFRFDKFDIVISVTSESAKGIKVGSKTLHICYCLTPTRYLWSGYNEYFKKRWFRSLTSPFVSYLRLWDISASKRPHFFIAISKEVQARIKKYYARDSIVIYPPLTLKVESSKFKVQSSKHEYFLVVSRLVPYKRVDLAILACNKLSLPLKIVGTGSQFSKLKKIAGSNVEFLGSLTERKLVEYYKNCRALIFPGKEDFGLVLLEAQSFGKPVVAFNRGGAKELVINGRTGILFDSQNRSSLTRALTAFQKKSFNPKDCIRQAGKFNAKVFGKEFNKIMLKLYRQAQL